MAYHEPVLASESVEALAIRPGGTYVDATFGGGGHSRLILEKLGEEGRLLGFDQDEDALANVPEDERFTFVHHNFRFLKRFLRLHRIREVDGILADLGVSSHQLDVAERGFSYRFDAALDMRMNQQQEKTAATVVNTYEPAALQEVFSRYGEVRNARTLAQRLLQEREHRPIETIGAFLAAVEPVIRGHRARYLSQAFQALRIEVNDEMGALQEFLEQSLELLRPQGRLVVITYHSVEDRMVKNYLKAGNFEGRQEKDFYGNILRPFRLITRKAVVPSEEEVKRNPRARSAKLRVGEKAEAGQ
ncbi:MAG: 16S rRNA (cytosine(1402)-N(4))-methyltransferase RsmH [Phaeodactylibacter sp.]|nr:16S rRNA (cytosine(1402)-N(4))-methyltransferase RsmH [Phaeodactylibacter sp.]MCB9264211.1 16S rRNA (cytosine(1402)-N(4))-methyltransferase RsmH [Lewinellaceae bacterium]MCB9291271.1 16S rRNA (cytosine(1402)-N(4))-methyltransferase RsmH [Lewinellaceae bacterium]